MGETKPKKCLFCGRFFVPDPRVGERQKACSRKECQKERKRLAQFKWCRKNPKYFADRYEYVRDWRERRTSMKIQEGNGNKTAKRVRKKRLSSKKGNGGQGWYKG